MKKIMRNSKVRILLVILGSLLLLQPITVALANTFDWQRPDGNSPFIHTSNSSEAVLGSSENINLGASLEEVENPELDENINIVPSPGTFDIKPSTRATWTAGNPPPIVNTNDIGHWLEITHITTTFLAMTETTVTIEFSWTDNPDQPLGVAFQGDPYDVGVKNRFNIPAEPSKNNGSANYYKINNGDRVVFDITNSGLSSKDKAKIDFLYITRNLMSAPTYPPTQIGSSPGGNIPPIAPPVQQLAIIKVEPLDARNIDGRLFYSSPYMIDLLTTLSGSSPAGKQVHWKLSTTDLQSISVWYDQTAITTPNSGSGLISQNSTTAIEQYPNGAVNVSVGLTSAANEKNVTFYFDTTAPTFQAGTKYDEASKTLAVDAIDYHSTGIFSGMKNISYALVPFGQDPMSSDWKQIATGGTGTKTFGNSDEGDLWIRAMDRVDNVSTQKITTLYAANGSIVINKTIAGTLLTPPRKLVFQLTLTKPNGDEVYFWSEKNATTNSITFDTWIDMYNNTYSGDLPLGNYKLEETNSDSYINQGFSTPTTNVPGLSLTNDNKIANFTLTGPNNSLIIPAKNKVDDPYKVIAIEYGPYASGPPLIMVGTKHFLKGEFNTSQETIPVTAQMDRNVTEAISTNWKTSTNNLNGKAKQAMRPATVGSDKVTNEIDWSQNSTKQHGEITLYAGVSSAADEANITFYLDSEAPKLDTTASALVGNKLSITAKEENAPISGINKISYALTDTSTISESDWVLMPLDASSTASNATASTNVPYPSAGVSKFLHVRIIDKVGNKTEQLVTDSFSLPNASVTINKVITGTDIIDPSTIVFQLTLNEGQANQKIFTATESVDTTPYIITKWRDASGTIYTNDLPHGKYTLTELSPGPFYDNLGFHSPTITVPGFTLSSNNKIARFELTPTNNTLALPAENGSIGTLELTVPNSIDFGVHPVYKDQPIINRTNDLITVEVKDTRANPHPWKLYAVSTDQVVKQNNIIITTLDYQALQFSPTTTNHKSLASAQKIMDSTITSENNNIYKLDWAKNDNSGIVARSIKSPNAKTGDYRSTITWTFQITP